MKNSLLWKMTFAFMLVALCTAALVAVFIRSTNIDRLSKLLVDQQRTSLHTALVAYYTSNGSWDGIESEWQHLQLLPSSNRVGPDNAQPNPPNNRDRPNFFGLADASGTLLVPFGRDYYVGQVMPGSILNDGVPITVDGQQIGTILTPQYQPHFNPAENSFLQRTNEALTFAVLGAMFVALIIGVLLALTLIRPLQALTKASQKIAQGELEQTVKVTSKDEIGQLADAFNTMSQEVSRVNRLRRQMTADIAHDLRTPLTVISGYIEAMRDGVLQPTTSRLTLIYTEIEHLQHLVGDLRMLSQVDAGELPLHPQPIAPQTLLERAAAPFMHRAETQQVSLQVQSEESLPDINVDEDRMMQVFSNLLSNALRYTPEGGQIQLSARQANGNVVLSVRDSGTGIPQEELSHIFDRFYRVDKSRSDAGETGLGLAIIKALVEAHHGKVQVESKLGEYSAFYIQLNPA